MAQHLPSEEQIIAILRDEPMVGSQLRGALGLPKKQKMARPPGTTYVVTALDRCNNESEVSKPVTVRF